ncbi:cytochrome bd-I ubiquinol oxidase subunit 2 apoprotein [Actinomadura pelletieri DSM 43383]|uniref:Cytochrome bd-I ubiquinol oxidase subunit 2 apoprotein n=1 Tax=Actinomadura pelletieri DSM 43383 TaxID=1120940 RepID=A0A495QLZ2_9ACTN|nr:cytochrome d ubiquinol oxidase subunit II [Actinomadura pelletieri]RKS73536.1 cytochrome bd-I ubiquinol oxidase subunit 2 apoprotein [Actinomadura pelletieri DSM 43383]
MDVLAVMLLAVFSGAYLALAGADIGVGMLLPWLGRDQRERRLVIASFAPFFLGNEVWLVASAGLVAGAFPGLEHELLEELYPLFVVLLIGWVVRDMGLWSRGRVDAVAWRDGCDAAVVAGSWALAVAWGAVLGSLLFGGGLGVGTVVGVPLVVLFVWHGAGFARWRLPVGLAGRAARIPSRYGLSVLVMASLPVVAGAEVSWSRVVAEGAGLTMTAVTTAAVLPLLVASQALVWWTFRGRVESPSYL